MFYKPEDQSSNTFLYYLKYISLLLLFFIYTSATQTVGRDPVLDRKG